MRGSVTQEVNLAVALASNFCQGKLKGNSVLGLVWSNEASMQFTTPFTSKNMSEKAVSSSEIFRQKQIRGEENSGLFFLFFLFVSGALVSAAFLLLAVRSPSDERMRRSCCVHYLVQSGVGENEKVLNVSEVFPAYNNLQSCCCKFVYNLVNVLFITCARNVIFLPKVDLVSFSRNTTWNETRLQHRFRLQSLLSHCENGCSGSF